MKNINQSTNNNKKYAIAYIRLQRTKLGIDDLHRSRSDQKERCEKAIKESEYTLLKTIEDTLVSGNTLNRKGIKEIIKLVKNKIYKITDRYKDGNINNYKLDDGFWEYESNLIPLTREEKLAIKFNL